MKLSVVVDLLHPTDALIEFLLKPSLKALQTSKRSVTTTSQQVSSFSPPTSIRPEAPQQIVTQRERRERGGRNEGKEPSKAPETGVYSAEVKEST